MFDERVPHISQKKTHLLFVCQLPPSAVASLSLEVMRRAALAVLIKISVQLNMIGKCCNSVQIKATTGTSKKHDKSAKHQQTRCSFYAFRKLDPYKYDFAANLRQMVQL